MIKPTRSPTTATQRNQEEPTAKEKSVFWERFKTSKVVKLICYIVRLLFTPCGCCSLKSRNIEVVEANKHPTFQPSRSFSIAQGNEDHIGEQQGIAQSSIDPANSLVSVISLGSQASQFFSRQDDSFASESQQDSLNSEDTSASVDSLTIYEAQFDEGHTDVRQQDTTQSLRCSVGYQTFVNSLAAINTKLPSGASQDSDEDHHCITTSSPIGTILSKRPLNSFSLDSLESQVAAASQNNESYVNEQQQSATQGSFNPEYFLTIEDLANGHISANQNGESYTDTLQQDAAQDSVTSLSTSTDSQISTDNLSAMDTSSVDPSLSLSKSQASIDSRRATPVTFKDPETLTEAQNNKICNHLNALFQPTNSSQLEQEYVGATSLLAQLLQSSKRGYELLQGVFEKTLTEGTPQDSADIANYFFLIATLHNQPFSDGSYMVQDKDYPENIKLLFNFLKNCGAYTRKSSHLHTQSDTTQHFGIDLTKELFPRHHYHLLFFETNDRRLFMKPEHAGLNGITDIVVHGWEWLVSAVQRAMNHSQEDATSVVWRKERPSYLPAEDKNLLKQFISLLQTPMASATSHQLEDHSFEDWSNISMPLVRGDELQSIMQDIETNGLSALVRIVNRVSNLVKNNPQLTKEFTAIIKQLEERYPQVEDRIAREVIINLH